MAEGGAVHDGEEGHKASPKRAPKPLDGPGLEALAFAYVARFATSAVRLERYLVRKLRERGWSGEGAADPAALVMRFCEAGYVDDRAFAEARSAGLLRRGYGPRRIGSALSEAGIGGDIRDELRPGEAARRGAALAMARKRRFGPFGGPVDPARREKQLAALIRAGHSFGDARALLDATNVAAAQEWVAEGEGE